MTKDSPAFISFAEGRLGERPVRLDLVANEPDWFAVAKPAGLVLTPDLWYPGEPDLITALKADLQDGKPQLSTLGIEVPYAINRLDRDESGLALLAKNETAGADLRNRSGSGQIRLTYQLLVDVLDDEAFAECDLPMARHRDARKVLVSSTTGKKAQTTFRRIESFGRVQLWEAETAYGRLHQVRLHAAECGLAIIGESVYNAVPLIYLSQLKRGFRRSGQPEKPIYEHLALHLSKMRIQFDDGPECCVEAPPPKGFSVLMRRLREFPR